MDDAEQARAILREEELAAAGAVEPHKIAIAQARATLAVAEAIDELVAAVQNVRSDLRDQRGF